MNGPRDHIQPEYEVLAVENSMGRNSTDSLKRVVRLRQPSNIRNHIRVIIERIQIVNFLPLHVRDNGCIAKGEPVVRFEQTKSVGKVLLCRVADLKPSRLIEPLIRLDSRLLVLCVSN